jgi:hypothetical protein
MALALILQGIICNGRVHHTGWHRLPKEARAGKQNSGDVSLGKWSSDDQLRYRSRTRGDIPMPIKAIRSRQRSAKFTSEEKHPNRLLTEPIKNWNVKTVQRAAYYLAPA